MRNLIILLKFVTQDVFLTLHFSNWWLQLFLLSVCSGSVKVLWHTEVSHCTL